MTGMLILDLLYLMVAILALSLTRAEARAREAAEPGQTAGPKGVLWGLAGVLACAVWPVTLVVMAATILVTARRAAAAQADEEKAQTVAA